MLRRRRFLNIGLSGLAAATLHGSADVMSMKRANASDGFLAPGMTPRPDEDLPAYVQRVRGRMDEVLYQQVLGAANEFKEGDAIIGVAAADETARRHARDLLSRTTVRQIDQHASHRDNLYELILRSLDRNQHELLQPLTMQELKSFLLNRTEDEIRTSGCGMSSDVIAAVVRLMTNEELIQVGSRIFNPLPNTQIGARGYMGARVQPNSPTDHPDDIRWQVLDAFSYAVGDVLLGTNPVSSDPESVAGVERVLQDLLSTFGITDLMPHCVLSHIDVQAEVEKRYPGTTQLWFQSIAGNDEANAVFDISVEKMVRCAESRNGRYGLYFETGQGADFTNGCGHGMDMVQLESRKYGFARALTQTVRSAIASRNSGAEPWIHLNDVAGFIGPEVFRTKEQLVRCCLEDIVMGKLHGLTIGLDICSTLHMDVSLEDLKWCIDSVMPACPAYLMALPTPIDPMLGYLTTGYHDHVRVREKFGYKVSDGMWDFFKRLGVIDASGQPTKHFGDPSWVYLQYCRIRQDRRSDEQILAEAKQKITEVRSRGVFLAEGSGATPSSPEPRLAEHIQQIYEDARTCIWLELTQEFVSTIPRVVPVRTRSLDRTDYILHPQSGEQLSDDAVAVLKELRQKHADHYDAQLVISDGLNARAAMDGDQLLSLIDRLRVLLAEAGWKTAPENIVVQSGRVRAGYRIGEVLFGNSPGRKTLLHLIGERPGSGHHTLSVYLTNADGNVWGIPQKIDHQMTKVVSGIASTALAPELAAIEVVRILKQV